MRKLLVPVNVQGQTWVRIPVVGSSGERLGLDQVGYPGKTRGLQQRDRWPRGEECVVAITLQAHDGEANEDAIDALAKALGVGKSRLQIVKGATFREKVVEISLDLGARAQT